MPPTDDPKPQRLGIRLSEAQYAHLESLMHATGESKTIIISLALELLTPDQILDMRNHTSDKSKTALVSRAMELLTPDQIPDTLAIGEEVPAPLQDEIWSQLVLNAFILLEESVALNRRLLKAYARRESITHMALYRPIHRSANILNRLAKTLLTLRNGNRSST